MALYRQQNSPYWWMTLVNPRTGQRIRKSTKMTDKAKAMLVEEQLIASIVLGETHYTLQENKAYTWDKAAERWLKETSHKKDHHNDKVKLRWLQTYLGDIELANITHATLHKIGTIKKQQTSNATANRVLVLTKSILNRAHKEWGWLDKAPYIKLYPETKERIRYLSYDEADKLLQELPSHLRSMASFTLCTGLRASNVTGLTWPQIDLERQHMFVSAEQSKSKKAIPVPLSKAAIAILEQQLGKNETYVFTYEGKPISRPNNHAWRKALVRADITNFRWHDLRHTWATWHIQNGTPLHVLQELGGWHSYDMVRRYAHLTSEHLARHVDNIRQKE